jgi:hypothetical protein
MRIEIDDRAIESCATPEFSLFQDGRSGFDERNRDDRAKLCTLCTCTREYRLYQKNRCRSVDRVANSLVSIVASLADLILGVGGFPQFYVSRYTDSAERDRRVLAQRASNQVNTLAGKPLCQAIETLVMG